MLQYINTTDFNLHDFPQTASNTAKCNGRWLRNSCCVELDRNRWSSVKWTNAQRVVPMPTHTNACGWTRSTSHVIVHIRLEWSPVRYNDKSCDRKVVAQRPYPVRVNFHMVYTHKMCSGEISVHGAIPQQRRLAMLPLSTKEPQHRTLFPFGDICIELWRMISVSSNRM